MSERKGRGDIHITNNYYAPIGQHIDHVDTLNFRMDGDGTFHLGHVEEITGSGSVSSDENKVTNSQSSQESTVRPSRPIPEHGRVSMCSLWTVSASRR